jgi:hypothetical protein
LILLKKLFQEGPGATTAAQAISQIVGFCGAFCSVLVRVLFGVCSVFGGMERKRAVESGFHPAAAIFLSKDTIPKPSA